MTMHYGETITADQIIEGWKYHGETMPMAFGTFTWGDMVAYNCWNYLYHLGKGTEDMPAVEEYFAGAPEDKREELIQILNDTIEKFHALPPNPKAGIPWPFNQQETKE